MHAKDDAFLKKKEIESYFQAQIDAYIASKPKNFRSWNRFYILITGEDGYEQMTKVYGKNKVLTPVSRDSCSFIDYISDRLLWYSLKFDYRKAKVEFLNEENLPEHFKKDCKTVCWSSRMGNQLNNLLK